MTTFFLFDIDNTLFESKWGVLDYMGTRRFGFYSKYGLGHISDEELTEKYHKYGTSIKGCAVEYQKDLDAIEFLQHVSEGSTDLIKYSREELDDLKGLFGEISSQEDCQLWILSNACDSHTFEVLKKLELEKFFNKKRIFNANSMDKIEKYLCKPSPLVFECVEKRIGYNRDVDTIYYVEDCRKSTLEAAKRGWKSIFVCYDENPNQKTMNVKNIFALKELLIQEKCIIQK